MSELKWRINMYLQSIIQTIGVIQIIAALIFVLAFVKNNYLSIGIMVISAVIAVICLNYDDEEGLKKYN